MAKYKLPPEIKAELATAIREHGQVEVIKALQNAPKKQKRCALCRMTKPAGFFYKQTKRLSKGKTKVYLSGYCKKCVIALNNKKEELIPY